MNLLPLVITLPFDPTATITDLVTAVGTVFGSVAGPAAGLGGAVLALFFGWRVVQRFTH